ncbi:hypothetical protein ACFVY0_45170 [Streptomyces sp. NPDC058286]|uniref:hypothetical protein n=1 Tax=Streptomyces sp. NPDC058286 TaxID=3346422 RepID=UPI0036E239BE
MPGDDVDHRGTSFTAPLPSELLGALRDPGTGQPHLGDAWFWSATFKGDALFQSASSKGNAGFLSAAIEGDARFELAAFERDAWFEAAAIEGEAWFHSAWRYHPPRGEMQQRAAALPNPPARPPRAAASPADDRSPRRASHPLPTV